MPLEAAPVNACHETLTTHHRGHLTREQAQRTVRLAGSLEAVLHENWWREVTRKITTLSPVWALAPGRESWTQDWAT